MATAGSTERILAEIEAEELRLRLGAIEADLAGSRKERLSREEQLRRYCCNGPVDAGPPPAEGSFTWRIQDAQRKAHERRRRAGERQAAEYETQLARVQPEVDRLQAQMTELGQRVAEVQRKRDAEIAKLDASIQKARSRIGELQRPPEFKPEPNPDAVEVLPFYRDSSGRMQYAPRPVVEGLHAARQRGLSQTDAIRHLIDTGVIDASDYSLSPSAP